MEQISGRQIVRVGVALAKRVIQVHAVDAAGHVVVAKALSREKLLAEFGLVFAQSPQALQTQRPA